MGESITHNAEHTSHSALAIVAKEMLLQSWASAWCASVTHFTLGPCSVCQMNFCLLYNTPLLCIFAFFSSFFHRVLSQICKNDKNVFFPLNMHDILPLNDVCMYIAPGGHWPFHASPVVRKGPISSKSQFTRTIWNLTLYTASIFAQILALKPPYLEIFSSQAPKFGNFQFRSPLFQRQISVRKPHTSEIQAAPAHTLYLKKVECPPGHCLVLKTT